MTLILAGCHAKPLPFLSDLKMSDHSSERQLIAGFHPLENNQWRWTARRFAVVLQPSAGAERSGATLRLQIFIPDSQIQLLGPMTLTADVGETSLPPQTFTKGGAFSYLRDVPPAVIHPHLLLPVVFRLDKALAPTAADVRELGAVVTEVALEPHYQQQSRPAAPVPNAMNIAVGLSKDALATDWVL